jgi:hypothetical protein
MRCGSRLGNLPAGRLMLCRAVPETWRRDRRITSTAALYSGLAAVSGVATVVMEFGWYGLTKKIDPWRVLYANETIARGCGQRIG